MQILCSTVRFDNCFIFCDFMLIFFFFLSNRQASQPFWFWAPRKKFYQSVCNQVPNGVQRRRWPKRPANLPYGSRSKGTWKSMTVLLTRHAAPCLVKIVWPVKVMSAFSAQSLSKNLDFYFRTGHFLSKNCCLVAWRIGTMFVLYF